LQAWEQADPQISSQCYMPSDAPWVATIVLSFCLRIPIASNSPVETETTLLVGLWLQCPPIAILWGFCESKLASGALLRENDACAHSCDASWASFWAIGSSHKLHCCPQAHNNAPNLQCHL